MLWSKLGLKTLRENPADAEMASHRLLMRSGFIKKLAPGIFTYSSLFLKSLRKFESLLREEFADMGVEEILMPMVQPAEIWEATNRWGLPELLMFKNRNQQDFCLGATHEECVSHFVKNDIKSYRDLPRKVFQIQTKYRDEIRPRFGLMRGREFIMNDAYSFDRSEAAALESYEKFSQLYHRVFTRLGIEYKMVSADSGAMGGSHSHEFQVLAENGMDELLLCSSCDYAGNIEAVRLTPSTESKEIAAQDMEEFATPGLKTIEALSKAVGVPSNELIKSFFVKYSIKDGSFKTATLLVPGDREVNFAKVKKVLGAVDEPAALSDREVYELTGSAPGSCGPVGLENIIVMDTLLPKNSYYIVGANKEGFHLKGVKEGRDFKASVFSDISSARSGDPCPVCQESLSFKNGIEVGHIFYLGQKYSKPMELSYLDESGKSHGVEMGCYGIGVTRVLQAVIEQNFDDDGMVWPQSLCPYLVHVCLLDPGEEKSEKVLLGLLGDLELGLSDILIDDRKERPGIKFKDADLLGAPLRIVIGKRGIEKDEVEVFNRQTREKHVVKISEAKSQIVALMSGLK